MTDKNNFQKTLITPFFTALDFDDLDKIQETIESVQPYSNYFKIGLEAVTKFGVSNLVEILKKYNSQVFLDIKIHDIPNTVAGAVRSAEQIGADFVTIHSTTGKKALEEAVKNVKNIKLLGVSILTSIDDDECLEIYGKNTEEKVLERASVLNQVGFYGMVCSAKEAKMIRSKPEFDNLKLVTPGIRPSFSQKGDQARIMTPAEAVKEGVDYMVIGRPITQHQYPAVAAKMILKEISEINNINK